MYLKEVMRLKQVQVSLHVVLLIQYQTKMSCAFSAKEISGLSPPVKCFTDRSKAVLLLWIFYVFALSCVCYVFVCVCLYVLCGHLLGKG